MAQLGKMRQAFLDLAAAEDELSKQGGGLSESDPAPGK